jgi:hypothetical protein
MGTGLEALTHHRSGTLKHFFGGLLLPTFNCMHKRGYELIEIYEEIKAPEQKSVNKQSDFQKLIELKQ